MTLSKYREHIYTRRTTVWSSVLQYYVVLLTSLEIFYKTCVCHLLQDKQDLQQLQLAATVLAVSRAGSMYPGLECTAPIPSQQSDLPPQAVNPESLATALEAASAADSAAGPAASAAAVDDATSGQHPNEDSQAHPQSRAVVDSSSGSADDSAQNESSAQQHRLAQVSHMSHEMVPETSVNSPQAAPGSPKLSTASGMPFCINNVSGF